MSRSAIRWVLAGRFVALRPVSMRRAQGANVRRCRLVFGRWRLDHKPVEYIPDLLTAVGVNAGDDPLHVHIPNNRRQANIGPLS